MAGPFPPSEETRTVRDEAAPLGAVAYWLEELGAGSIAVAIWALIGSAGMMYGGLRYLSALFRREPTTGQPGEGWYQIALLSAGVVMLFVAGVFPTPMISMMLNVLSGFANLF